MPFVSDSFTDTDGQLLTDHAGEVGASWTRHPSYNISGQIWSNRCRKTSGQTNQAGVAYASGAPPSADYYVQADFVLLSNTNNNAHYVAARMDTAVATFIIAGYSMHTDATYDEKWLLWKNVSGTFTLLASWAQAYATETRVGKVTVEGVNPTTIKVFVDGEERINVQDSDIDAAGKAGQYIYNTTDSTTDGLSIDNFEAGGLEVAATSMIYRDRPQQAILTR
jgi:hypothetical protein